ncbi:hypothetical protein AB205_0200650 [Aquarana catesbeiana]|uniref:G-protein coupled receptors family 1 profile domain-containing protein n=1 Tax=Aquarana catesbeiana TaxID=8400 RepID=A0A2G9RMW8_AQUCT|nr:hypothetical protein AB205_0200650 [Aquarana catesbeiana]
MTKGSISIFIITYDDFIRTKTIFSSQFGVIIMYTQNQSTVTEFILLGLSSDTLVQVLLFHIFLVVYMTTLTGNVLLMVAVRTDKRLHTSMYIFLSSLSFLDICYTSSTVPKMLVNFLSPKKSISFTGCVVHKAFSTCIPHLVVVVFFYGSAMFMYGRPEHLVTGDTDKRVSVFYTVITPMLNPLIYSLRNKDVQGAMRRLIRA